MELIDELTRSLGVTPAQAEGGAGLVLKQAQQNLGADEFSKLAAAAPGLAGLIGKAPSSGGGALGGLGGLASALGGSTGGSVGSMLSLAGGFSKLGMGTGMVEKFIPIILRFLESKGGSGVKAILEKALK